MHRQCNVRRTIDYFGQKELLLAISNITLLFSVLYIRDYVMQVVMKQYVDTRCAIYEFEREFWEGVVTKIVAHEKFNALPFSYIGEVQFLTDEYMEMRKESHLWYKILRQTYAYDLMNDLNKFYLPVKTRYKTGETALKEV